MKLDCDLEVMIKFKKEQIELYEKLENTTGTDEIKKSGKGFMKYPLNVTKN